MTDHGKSNEPHDPSDCEGLLTLALCISNSDDDAPDAEVVVGSFSQAIDEQRPDVMSACLREARDFELDVLPSLQERCSEWLTALHGTAPENFILTVEDAELRRSLWPKINRAKHFALAMKVLTSSHENVSDVADVLSNIKEEIASRGAKLKRFREAMECHIEGESDLCFELAPVYYELCPDVPEALAMLLYYTFLYPSRELPSGNIDLSMFASMSDSDFQDAVRLMSDHIAEDFCEDLTYLDELPFSRAMLLATSCMSLATDQNVAYAVRALSQRVLASFQPELRRLCLASIERHRPHGCSFITLDEVTEMVLTSLKTGRYRYPAN